MPNLAYLRTLVRCVKRGSGETYVQSQSLSSKSAVKYPTSLPRRAKKDSNIPSPGRTRSVKCPNPGPKKTIKSPPHALPPSHRLYIDRCIMDQKTLLKHRWSYKVHITVYILTRSEFTRHEFTDLWLETLPDTLSLSLTGIRLCPKQARIVNDSVASLSPAEQWTIAEICRPSNSVLTYSLLRDFLPL